MSSTPTQYDTRTSLAALSDADLSRLAQRTWGRDRPGDAAVVLGLGAPGVTCVMLAVLCELELREERREQQQ